MKKISKKVHKIRCEKGLKATLKYCEEKRRCFEGTVEDIYQ